MAATIAFWLWHLPENSVATLPIPGEELPTEVEVLNATNVDGLARTTTRLLRRAGIDVVYFGTARGFDLDSTVLLVRRGDSTVADPVRDALGIGRVVVESDSSLLLDVTVLLGRDLASARRVSP